MRIKAVLRDSEILKMDSGSQQRIDATTAKNLERFVGWSSLLKVMGLKFEERTKMLDALKDKDLKIWLGIEGNQHIIFLSKDTLPNESDYVGYQWQ